MAVSAARRNRNGLGKRSEYVYNDDSRCSSMDGFSSSGDESGYTSHRKLKVRSVKSIRSLLKDSQSFEKSEEHAYTQSTTCRNKRARRNTESDFLYEPTVSKKSRCDSKNAINARINRERKKAYLTSLEEEVQQLRDLNKDSGSRLVSQEATIGNLKQEVTHLKSLLANNKYLCTLVSKLSEVTGLPVTSSLVSKIKEEGGLQHPHPRTRSVPLGLNHPIARKDVYLGSCDTEELYPAFGEDSDSLFPSLEAGNIPDFETNEFLPLEYRDPNDETEKSVGICVHINQNRLSVEFCALCNARAMSS